MKHISIIILIALSFNCLAQLNGKQDESHSKIENLFQQSDKLLRKDFYDLGTINQMQLQILTITDISDMSNTTKVNGLRFEFTYKSTYTSDEKIAFLDADEINDLIKSIETMQTQIFTTKAEHYTEVIFRSRSGFEAGAYWDDKVYVKDSNGIAHPGSWRTFIKLEEFDGNSEVFWDANDFALLLDLLKKAKQKI